MNRMGGASAGAKVRLILKVEDKIAHALKVRAAEKRTTMSGLVTEWVRAWTKSRNKR